MFTFIANDGTQTTYPDWTSFHRSLATETYVCGTAVVNYANRGGQLVGRLVDMSHDYTRSRYGI